MVRVNPTSAAAVSAYLNRSVSGVRGIVVVNSDREYSNKGYVLVKLPEGDMPQELAQRIDKALLAGAYEYGFQWLGTRGTFVIYGTSTLKVRKKPKRKAA